MKSLQFVNSWQKKILLSNKIITPNRLFLIITEEFFVNLCDYLEKLCDIAITQNPQRSHKIHKVFIKIDETLISLISRM